MLHMMGGVNMLVIRRQRRAAAQLRLAQAMEYFGNRSRMKPRPQKRRDGLPMTPDSNRPQILRSIGSVQLPVLAKFPREKAENTGCAQGDQSRCCVGAVMFDADL